MRISIDYVPSISDITSDDPQISQAMAKLVEQINTTLARLNEILRVMGIAINTIEMVVGTTAENILCDHIATEFGSAGTEFSAGHGLNRIPVAIIGQKMAGSGSVYFSKNATSSNIYLKSDSDSLSGSLIIA